MMSGVLLIAAWGLGLVLAPSFGFMLLVVVAALFRMVAGPRHGPPGLAPETRFLIIIPAHDESSVVGITVQSCLAVDFDPGLFQVGVIADNCTDDTAARAEAAGAVVVVRRDPERKSKGYALDDFFRGVVGNPAIRPCDAFVLVDADTSVAPDILAAFNRSLAGGADFIQGYYTVRNADASWRTRLMTHAFALANGVWLLGLDQLGLSVGLKGNGMCFRAEALRRFPWEAHGLVEDMEFAWKLRLAGERVHFQPAARVYGEMVSRGGDGAASQRRRWESGRKALRSSFRSEIGRSRALSWAAKLAYRIDLDFPPLSRLAVGLAIGSLLAAGTIMLAPESAWAVGIGALFSIYGMTLLTYAMSPVVTMGLPARYLLSLGHLPYYMLWKLTLGLLKAPQQWIRTPREST